MGPRLNSGCIRVLIVRQCTVAPLVSNHADKRSSSAWGQLLDVPRVRSRSLRPLPFFGSRRIRARLFPDGDLCRTPHAPALVASVGLGAELSGAHRRHVCGPAMRATRIAHRVEGFCRNGSRKATWSSGGRLRYRMPCSAPFGAYLSVSNPTSSRRPYATMPECLVQSLGISN